MKDGLFVFLLGNIVLGFIMAYRAALLIYKLGGYIQEHYPEKVKDLACSFRTGEYEFRLPRGLYKKLDIDDDFEFLRLKIKARNALTWGILALLPMSLFMILIVIMAFASRS